VTTQITKPIVVFQQAMFVSTSTLTERIRFCDVFSWKSFVNLYYWLAYVRLIDFPCSEIPTSVTAAMIRITQG